MRAILLIGELILLYGASGRLTQAIYDLTILLFRSRSVGITVISLLTFPGTVIHELSHLFTAEVLGVHTGKLTLVPENLETEDVKTGSVTIAATDPFRRYIIGLAPIFVGMIAITALSYFLSNYSPDWGNWRNIEYWKTASPYLFLFLGYLLFAVSNAMFSSPEDLKGFVPFALTIIIMVSAAYVAGLRIGLTGPALDVINAVLDALTKSLGVVLGIHLIGLIVTFILTRLAQSVTHRTIIHR